MGRTRTTRKDCEKEISKLEGFYMWTFIDYIKTEKDLQRYMVEEKLKGDRSKLPNRKFPDCLWHLKTCSIRVLELKGSSFKKAYNQLKNFAKNFPELHQHVEYYVIKIRGSKRQLKKLRIKCDPKRSRGDLCLPLRDLGKTRKEWTVGGKPIYLYFESH